MAAKRASKRKYGPKAVKTVGRVMHEWKAGRLHSGRGGPEVTSQEQAVAIGISEARREGDKVPKRAAKKTKASAQKVKRGRARTRRASPTS
jgi:hypothetical protein